MLVAADVVALFGAYEISQYVAGASLTVHAVGRALAFLAATSIWIAVAAATGLYDHDRTRMSHSTIDELGDLVKTVTLGTWLVFPMAWLIGLSTPHPTSLFVFWSIALALTVVGRASARAIARRTQPCLERVLVVGAGEVGQLVGRKLLQHPEYQLELAGFVDANPRDRRAEVAGIDVVGTLDALPQLIGELSIDRIIVAFSSEPHEQLIEVLRELRGLPVHVDVVPRLFELVSPRVEVHSVEGLPLVGLRPAAAGSLSRALKRTIDVIGSGALLLATAPLLALIVWRIKLDSPGPVFFRQTRLGRDMREFTVLKFRTMKVDVDDSEHRAYIQETMHATSEVGANGLYKLDQDDCVTPVGRWLRRNSLDELPQLINVLRGDMSLVGPRPCIPYETECFAPHHFERFGMQAGLTGLWQVTARAKASFGEALDMDVAYVRGWSIGLDLRLLLKTPLQLRQRGTT